MSLLHEHLTCELLLTRSCNMACSYCIARELPGDAMSFEIGRQAISAFVELAGGAKSIEMTFTGGEPLLEFSMLRNLILCAEERARDAGMDAQFVLKTNGTLLNEAIIDFVRAHRVKVVVSIDGTAAVHNQHRRAVGGRATHRVVSRNLLALLRGGVSCVGSITVHPDAATLVLDGVRYLHGLGLEQVDVGPAYGTVSWTEAEISAFGQSLMSVADFRREASRSGTRLEVEPLGQGSEHVGGILADRWGCQAASTNLAFLPNGDVCGCSALAMLAGRFPELVLGNVWGGLDQKAIDRMIALAQAGPDERTACRACLSSADCTGGCLAINYSTSGVAFVPPAVYCSTMSVIPAAWSRAWAEFG
jgi:uncharacterized protein